MDNYIMINGVCIDLTPEQIARLTPKAEEKNPLERQKNKTYYYVTHNFDVCGTQDIGLSADDKLYDIGNYCTDEAIMRQHALHIKLNQLLWRYSMTHGGDRIDCKSGVYCIAFGHENRCGDVISRINPGRTGEIYFVNSKIAEDAIVEVVKPFMEANPDFDWGKM